MTKHFSGGVTRQGRGVEIDAGYERGMHAAYLTVTDVAAVLAGRFGLRLPQEILAALESDYQGHALPAALAGGGDRRPAPGGRGADAGGG